MLVTDRDDIADQVRLMRSHGMTSLTWDRHKGHAYSYDVTALGYNYRIDEIRSALGMVQLEKLPQNNARREEIRKQYIQGLADTPVQIPFLENKGQSAHHLFPVILPAGMDRIGFIDALRTVQIQTSIHYPPIHQFSYYRQRYPNLHLPLTEDLASREVTLPLYPGMSDEMAGWVIEAVKQAL